MDYPQITLIVLCAFSLGVVVMSKQKILGELINTVILSSILYWGGFWS